MSDLLLEMIKRKKFLDGHTDGGREYKKKIEKKTRAKYNSVGRFTKVKFIFQSSWHASDIGAATKSHRGNGASSSGVFIFIVNTADTMCVYRRNRCILHYKYIYYLNGDSYFV